MEDRRRISHISPHVISILGTDTTVFQVIADLIEENITTNALKKEDKVQGTVVNRAFQFITDNNPQDRPNHNPARLQAFTIVVFDQNDNESIELMKHYLEELARYNKAAKHTFVLGVDYGNDKILSPEEKKKLLSRYKEVSYLEYSPRNLDSITALRHVINETVDAEAKQWYEWGNDYLEQYHQKPDNKQLVYKALCCFTAAYDNAPYLVGHNYLILLSELQSNDNHDIPEIKNDAEEQIKEAILNFKKKYPHYTRELIHIPYEQKEATNDRQAFDKMLLKQATDKLTEYAHPSLFKRLARKRHVKDIDQLVVHVKSDRVADIYELIERLDTIPNKKRSFLKCINEIRIIAGDEPKPLHTTSNKNKK